MAARPHRTRLILLDSTGDDGALDAPWVAPDVDLPKTGLAPDDVGYSAGLAGTDFQRKRAPVPALRGA